VLACGEHVALCTLSMAGCPDGVAVHRSRTALDGIACFYSIQLDPRCYSRSKACNVRLYLQKTQHS
jgi:hypothetical protein